MGIYMGLKIANEYELGDMRAMYLLDEEKQLVELLLLPKGKDPMQAVPLCTRAKAVMQ